MGILLVAIHVIVCIALIMIVLLQTGKGADMGAAFGGGGSQTLFGATGATTFLGKATTVAAVVFMLTSLTLAYRSSHRTAESIMQNPSVPIEETAPAATAPEPSATEETQPAATVPEAPAAEQPAAEPTTNDEGENE